MPFKVHLAIISCIVIVVVLAWQYMQHQPQTVEAAPGKTYSITVTHASWGLNCQNLAISSNQAENTRDPFLNKGGANNKLREDNVMAAVALLCNGNIQCDILADEATLGPDPAPDCTNKTLEIEYRCFSYDRPWNVKTSSGAATLNCEQPNKDGKS
jgi:hypothetical protein